MCLTYDMTVVVVGGLKKKVQFLYLFENYVIVA